MKLKVSIFSGLLIVILIVPLLLQGQSRYKSPYIKHKDEALRKSISGTLIPVALGVGAATLIENNTVETTASLLAVYGLIMGPSTGNFYAKDYLRGMLGVAVRLGGGYLILDATRELAGDDVADALGWDDKNISLTDTSVLVGGGIILGSTLYNILSSKASVNRFNEKQGYRVQLMPAVYNGKVLPMISGTIRF